MSPIRPFRPDDEEPVVALSLRAWEPVFAAVAAALAESGVFERMHPDWRSDQAAAVRAVCASPDDTVWVARRAGEVAGFVAARLHAADRPWTRRTSGTAWARRSSRTPRNGSPSRA